MKTGFTRRDFLKLAGTMTATAALPEYFTQIFAAGLERMAATTRVVWLQGQSCSGESISLLNSVDPSPADLLTRYISLVIHQNIMPRRDKLCGHSKACKPTIISRHRRGNSA